MACAVNTIIADDHPLFRSALRQAAATSVPEQYIKETSDIDGLCFFNIGKHSCSLLFAFISLNGIECHQPPPRVDRQINRHYVLLCNLHERVLSQRQYALE